MWDTETPANPNRPMMDWLRLPAAAVLVFLVVVRVLPVFGYNAAFPILTGFLGIAFAVWVGHRLWAGLGPTVRGWSLWLLASLVWVGVGVSVHAGEPALVLVPLVMLAGVGHAVLDARRRARRAADAAEREGRAG